MRNEIEIIQAVADGDKQALATLYKRYAEKIYNTALSYTKSIEDAEEITQDVFLKIYHSALSFKGSSSLNTWIYRIAVNTSLNYVKKRNRIRLWGSKSQKPELVDFNHPGVLLEQKENAKILFKLIDCLPARQKTAFILSYVEYLPRQEVADIMEISLKAVESLLQRAKQNMRLELEKMYPNRRNSRN